MSKIFITGICGFLGSHLANALIAEGHEVSGNDSLICGDKENFPNYFDIDCRDFDQMKEAMDGFDVLIHCAATAHEGLSSFSPSFITRNIFEASIATFSAAIASGVKRIVFMSSMARYGDGYKYCIPPFDETMTPAPVDCYGIAKVAAEDCLKNLCKLHGVNWSIAVPHNLVSIRQKYDDPFRNVCSIMINRCLQGKPPIVYGDGHQSRCFSPIDDCLPSIIKMVSGEADGQIINIGPDKGEITILQLAEKIMALTNFTGDILYFPDRPNEVKHAFCSSEKSRRVLGYQPKKSLDDCLAEMVADIKLRGTKEFDYFVPLEIITERTPKTWLKKII